MAIEKVIDIKIQGNADEAVGSLRSQLRAAQADVAALSDKFGATSQQAIEAAKRAGELKDRIGDAKALTDAFNPDAKFKSLSASLAGVAGGFAAVQGGMALFGGESKNVEATLLKVQSAMALSAGLQGLGEARDSFKQLGAVAGDVFKSIKAAIGSTGIGLLVIALAGVVTYWDEISTAISGATIESKAYEQANKGITSSLAKTQENLISVQISIDNAKKGIISKSEALKNYNEKLGEAFGKTDDLNIAEQRMAANTGKYIQAQIARATAQQFVAKAAEAAAKAASGENLDLSFFEQAKIALLGYGQIGKTLANKVRDNKNEISTYEKLAVIESEKADKLTTEINAAGINKRYEGNKKANDDAAAKAKEKADKDKEARKKEREDYLKDAEELDALKNKLEQNRLDKEAEVKKKADDIQQGLREDGEDPMEKLQRKYDEERAILEAAHQSTLLLDAKFYTDKKALEDEETVNKKANAESQEEIDKKKAQAREQYFAAGANTLKQASQLLGESTDAGKAAAVAAATIDTYQAAVSSYNSLSGITFVGPALGAVAAGVAVASGLANVKKILAVKTPKGGGGGGGVPTGGGAPSAPQFNVVGNSGVNQLAGIMATNEQTPVKAYVVPSDVTTGQSLDRNIIRNASLG